MTPDEFGQKIKDKYPDYNGMDNTELAKKIVEKYPDYASQVDFRQSKTPSNISESFSSGLAGKEQVSGFNINNASEFAGQNFGSIIGGLAGTPGGPVGIGVGAAAGRALQNAGQNIASGMGYDTRKIGLIRSIAEPALEGATNYIGAKYTGPLFKAASEFVEPVTQPITDFGANIGGGLMRIANNVKSSVGTSVLKNPGKFANAATPEEVSQAYKSFYNDLFSETGSNVAGRVEQIKSSGDPFDTVSRATTDMREAYQKLNDGTLTIKEAVNASQAARKIRDMKMRGNEMAQEVAQTADELKGSFDDFIDKNVPDKLKGAWQKLREMNYWKETREDFSSPFPQNINKSESVLRGMTGIGTALAGTMYGHPAALAVPFMQSPAIAGLAIRGAYNTSQIGSNAIGAIAPRLIPQIITNKAIFPK